MEIIGYVERRKVERRRRALRFAGLVTAFLAAGLIMTGLMWQRGYLRTAGWMAVFWSLWLMASVYWPASRVYGWEPQINGFGWFAVVVWLIGPWVWLGIEQGAAVPALLFGGWMLALAWMNWRDER